MKKTIFAGVVGLTLLLGACDAGETIQPVNEEKTKVEEVSSNPKVDIATMEQLMLSTLESAYDGTAYVNFYEEHKTYTITPSEESFGLGIVLMTQSEMDSAPWELIVRNTQIMSESIVGSMGEGYTIMFLNPVNTDKIFLEVTDGEIIYNILDDKNE